MNKMREFDENVWVKHLFLKIDAERNGLWKNNLQVEWPIITDLRQSNELDKCRAEGFTIVKVEADEKTRIERMIAAGDDFKMEDLRHPTELYIDDIDGDFTINNGSGVTYEELLKQTKAYINNKI